MAITIEHEIKTLDQLRPILRGFRKVAGLTQAMVASRLGVTQQTYAQFEANPASASVERLFKVLRVLNVELTLTYIHTASARPAAKQAIALPARKAAQASGSGRAAAKRPAPPASQSRPAPRAAERQPRPARKRAAPKKREDW